MLRALNKLRVAACAVAVFSVFASARLSHAAFHLWSISEIYSNSDGSVQFVELFTSSSGQTLTSGTHIVSNAHTFTFPSGLSQDTTNKHMLLATAGFGALAGGVTPDFTIPSNFFSVAGDTITYQGTVFPGTTFGAAPTDGVKSLNYPGASQVTNSPTNLAGASGSVNLSSPPAPTGDYNGNGVVDAADYAIWRHTFGQSVTAGSGADGNGNGTIDDGDYTFWASKFGNSAPGAGGGAQSAAAVPEPATTSLAMVGLLAIGALCTVGYSVVGRGHLARLNRRVSLPANDNGTQSCNDPFAPLALSRAVGHLDDANRS
jgi:hypothetical protein